MQSKESRDRPFLVKVTLFLPKNVSHKNELTVDVQIRLHSLVLRNSLERPPVFAKCIRTTVIETVNYGKTITAKMFSPSPLTPLLFLSSALCIHPILKGNVLLSLAPR